LVQRFTYPTSPSLHPSSTESKKKAINEVKGICKILRKFGISSDARILDFSCGIGNHSIPLSKKGYRVTGYDPSRTYLRIARRTAESNVNKCALKFIQGDPYCSAKVLANSGERNFDVIIIMDNSFGYDSKSKDIRMLKNLSKIANANCLLILETENRDWRLQNFEPITFFESDKIQILGKWQFHFETSVSQGSMKFYERRSIKSNNLKLSLKLQMLMKLYSLHELIELLQESGWNYRNSYDDISSLIPFANNSMSIFSMSFLK
jgi:SAM-dependent methyltransferase